MRSTESLRNQYRVERELADRLRNARTCDRRHLYSVVYNELFQRVPDHPQIVAKQNTAFQAAETSRQLGVIERFLRPDTIYLEIGAGDCALALAISSRVARVYAIDVSVEMASPDHTPANFELIISDGISIPVPEGSVDVVYSNQLIEHLHAYDAKLQLAQSFEAIRPGGKYICVTPNRLCGPHDVSRFFDSEPTCFHLKEYSNGELVNLFRDVGFRRFQALISYNRMVFQILLPLSPFVWFEGVIGKLPHNLCKFLAKPLKSVKFVATK